MKKLIYFIFLLSLFSCKESDDEFSGVVNDINEDFFECTVDFVQFLDEENVVVRFETTLGKQTNYFYGRYNYTKDGNNYRIGDNLVLINNFQNILPLN